MEFKDFGFKPFIYDALNALKFEEPTKIQQEVIPLIQKGKDVIGQSQTGSGKSHAFLLPLINELVPNKGEVQYVITTPTRELAEQIHNMTTEIVKHSEVDFKVKRYVGGRDRDKELAWLENNQPDIVIGTPGRIWDLSIKEKKLLIYKTKYFVVDEADMTLEAGFLKEIDNMAGTMDENLQMMVFSATIPEQLKPFLKKYMKVPIHIDLTDQNVTPVKLVHNLMPTRNRDKNKMLINIFNVINPFLAIIFTNTRKDASEVANFLRDKGMKVGEIHGDLTSRNRSRMMREIRDLKYQYIVATDIAARGIDIEGVSHIINYSLPSDPEFYIHRSGRTSRKNTEGLVISLYDREDDDYLSRLEKRGIKFNYIDISKKEFVPTKERNKRKTREKKEMSEIEKKARGKVKKKKRVAPGYKKKYKWKVENEMKKMNKRKRRK
ncbi:DEAD/DEAH box helicase [Haloplasma contractile]|uniref:DEAD-box ATP-dependent RNA helicase CshB protein n=1 Tax=Haloplasma contractile SSD-17B TaxID=1033810 RepID=U2EFW1_9MOLU|nr:DEAD/DEAH box helicase [Haloplasma contractile]ERJ13813.1 DEAD-box ATP-dependent RNA helicase CshB protein [Haloplasma contractile SSD-17B]